MYYLSALQLILDLVDQSTEGSLESLVKDLRGEERWDRKAAPRPEVPLEQLGYN